jgi:hypothetical protein
VIGVVVLQNGMDLVNGELSSCSGTGVTSNIDGNMLTGLELERVTDISELAHQEPTTIPVLRTEPNISCVPVVSVMDISYRLYPVLHDHISVCPCETNVYL